MFLKTIIRQLNYLKFINNISSGASLNLFLYYYFARYIFARKIPAVVYLEVTFKCQFGCIYCGINSYISDRDELSIKECKDIIGQLAKFRIPRIHFSGGEPLLKEDIEDLISYAYKKGMITLLETNGWELSSERISKLKKSRLSSICISLDGAYESTHDRCCERKGSFLRVIEAIKECRKQKMPCVISTVVRKELISSGELLNLFKFAEKLGVYGMRLISPRPMGRWLNEDSRILNDSERFEAINLSKKTTVPIMGQGPNERICGIMNGYSFCISPYGEVLACGYIPYSFGNIRSESLPNIWARIINHEMFKKKSGCLIQDAEFRARYIKRIKPNSTLPVKLY